ncbi:hydrogenase assembly protein HupF [Lamprobacter modestohalophilus]|uniref:Hydrogenase assembly protein HupF n=1 Tax=Lamprobacter modestohalophilus TaxID=1064514 RepID=A0A9X0W5F0_9GAMM|nr:HypC/HybG/HupF family hydrogenase formation chaperone [Lamprobacter modestohalophilus]MBK1617111.1 hydrogenase assembly protein HupF [Lamprobacter modestohalophilus]
MCLAIPAQILEIDQAADTGIVSLGGVRRPVSLALIDDADIGDFVLVHVGYALNKISAEEAERTLAMMREIGELAEQAEELSAAQSEINR